MDVLIAVPTCNEARDSTVFIERVRGVEKCG